MKLDTLRAADVGAVRTSDSGVTRRDVLWMSARLAVASLAGPALLAAPASAQAGRTENPTANSAVGAAMVERAAALLALLDADQRRAATFGFDSRTRQDWNYMLGARTAPGLSLERMTEPQKTAAFDLLATALNEHGMAKAQRVMVLQEVLEERSGQLAADRSRERFSTAIFGTPSRMAPWGWRFEGHHLTLSFTLIGDRVVSVTPSSFSSNPNEVSDGRHRGLVALVDEEAMGRRLFRDLSSVNRNRAIISDRAFGNVLALAGREDRISGPPAGVPVADLTSAQVDLAMRLVEVYAVDHLAPPLAEEQRARVREGDIMAARFGWAGADRPGEMVYYRLHGDTFLIEFASLRNQPLHLHTIRHDLQRNLGAHQLS